MYSLSVGDKIHTAAADLLDGVCVSLILLSEKKTSPTQAGQMDGLKLGKMANH